MLVMLMLESGETATVSLTFADKPDGTGVSVTSEITLPAGIDEAKEERFIQMTGKALASLTGKPPREIARGRSHAELQAKTEFAGFPAKRS